MITDLVLFLLVVLGCYRAFELLIAGLVWVLCRIDQHGDRRRDPRSIW